MLKKVLQIFSWCLSVITIANAQSVTFDYSNANLSTCNAFSSEPVINGYKHSLLGGRPYYESRTYSLGGSPLLNFNITLPSGVDNNMSTLSSGFEIDFPFLAFHTYEISVVAGRNGGNTTKKSQLGLRVAGQYGGFSSGNCDGPTGYGPQVDHYINVLSLSDYASTHYESNFTSVPYTFSQGSTTTGGLKIYALPSSLDGLGQEIYIRKVIIKDVSTNLPTFTLTPPSTLVKPCANNQNGQYVFKINNINNTPNTQYRFELEANQWKLPNGSIAPTIINQAGNTITLIPADYKGPTVVRGFGVVSGTPVYAGLSNISIIRPKYYIADPYLVTPEVTKYALMVDPLSIPGGYQILAPNLPMQSFSWTFSNNYALVGEPVVPPANNIPTWYCATGLVKNLPRGMTNASGILTANVNLCGENFLYTRPVSVGNYIIISSNLNFSGNSIDDIEFYPNPASSLLNIELKNIEYDEMDAEIYDLGGKVLSKHNFSKNDAKRIELNLLPIGIYVVRITVNGKTYVQKFQKNN